MRSGTTEGEAEARNPMRRAFTGCCACATAPATTSTQTIIESRSDFGFRIADFRLSNRNQGIEVRDVLVMTWGFNLKSKIENPKFI
jgi:hypothetical protein